MSKVSSWVDDARTAKRRAKTFLQREVLQPNFGRLMSLYPPYLGAGVVVRERGPLSIDVEMRLTRLNRNIVGTHFGGSLYSMCDPFYMLLLVRALDDDALVVWDKAATIHFRKPGRGRVMANFTIDAVRVESIRDEVRATGKSHPQFLATVFDSGGDVVCTVEKVLSVRKKR